MYNPAGLTRLLTLHNQLCQGDPSACVSLPRLLVSTALSLIWVCAGTLRRSLLCNKSVHVTLTRLNNDSNKWLRVILTYPRLVPRPLRPPAL